MALAQKLVDKVDEIWSALRADKVSGRVFERYKMDKHPLAGVTLNIGGQPPLHGTLENLSYGGIGLSTTLNDRLPTHADATISLTLLDQTVTAPCKVAHQKDDYLGLRFSEKTPDLLVFISLAVDYLKSGLQLSYEEPRSTEFMKFKNISESVAVTFDGSGDDMIAHVKLSLDHSIYDVEIAREGVRCATTPQGVLGTNVIQISDVVDKPALRAAIFIIMGLPDARAREHASRAINWGFKVLGAQSVK